MAGTEYQHNGLPTLKGNIRFKPSLGSCSVDVYTGAYTHDEDGCVCKFERTNERWRWAHGPFANVHCIAREIFDYRQDLTEEEMHFMGDFVHELGRIIDYMLESLSEEVFNEKNRRLVIRPKKPKAVFFPEEGEDRVSAVEHTFVYLMRHTNGLTKIGFSRNPKAREKTLQAEDPRLELFFSAPGTMKTEKHLHAKYASVRERGEWFRLSQEDIDWIVNFVSAQSASVKPTTRRQRMKSVDEIPQYV